jgi:hypothetical protein
MVRYQGATSRLVGSALAMALMIAGLNPANAASLTSRSVQILSRAIAFLQPAPSGTATVAIAYDPAEPVSKQDADAIAEGFGEGLRAGPANLKSQVIEVGLLASGHFVAVIAAEGVNIDQVFRASQALRIPCVTADAVAVQGARCVMSVKSDPKVDIQISADAAAKSGVAFGSAFLFMARVN